MRFFYGQDSIFIYLFKSSQEKNTPEWRNVWSVVSSL